MFEMILAKVVVPGKQSVQLRTRVSRIYRYQNETDLSISRARCWIRSPRVCVKASSGDVYYFAYGSNLNTTVLNRRRAVVPDQVIPAVVNEFALEFSVPGIPYLEPAFATIVPDTDRCVHGLACLVSEDQWERIQLTETGYDIVDVRCSGYDGTKFDAKTLVFPQHRRRRGLRPSRRYIELIKEGASEWNLDKKWQEHLNRIEAFDPFQTSEQQVGAVVAVASTVPLGVTAALATIAGSASSEGSTSTPGEETDKLLTNWTNITWDVHDTLWRSILGDGGTMSSK